MEKDKDRSILVKLGLQIKLERTKKSMSQEGLGYEAGLDRTYIGGIERGERNPSILNLEKISNAFNLSLSELFEKVESLEV